MNLRESIWLGDLPLVDSLFILTLLLKFAFNRIDLRFPVVLGCVSGIGHLILAHFYRYAVETIFNAQVPKWNRPERALSYFEIYKMSRPLEAIWRLLTYKLRELPDVIILGEVEGIQRSINVLIFFLLQVRCGTTTLCSHISSISRDDFKIAGRPFSPWKHAELGDKVLCRKEQSSFKC